MRNGPTDPAEQHPNDCRHALAGSADVRPRWANGTSQLVARTMETPAGPLTLDVFPGPDCEGELYDDDGHSMAFAASGYYRQHVRCELNGERIARIIFAPAYGKRLPWWRLLAVTIHQAQKVRPRLGKRVLSATTQDGVATFTVPFCAKGCTIEMGGSR
jgi:alpha-glucosidase